MGSGATASRYWRTLRHLRPGQFWHRLKFRLHRPRVDLSPRPSLRSATASWVAPAARLPSMLGPERFRFLNQNAELTHWDDPQADKLWRYNLHYFDDLNAFGAATRSDWHRGYIDRWIADNPPGSGTGWEPYPTSMRIVNWVKFALGGNALPDAALDSLAIQSRWMTGRIEWHLLGNHLFSNAKALLFAGSFFSGPEADEWLRQGMAILDRELDEQILADGGQFERSPMYHVLALEDVLDLVNIGRTFGAFDGGRLAARLPSMRRWMAAMCHPDGQISFFNDAAFGIAPTPGELDAYARRLGLPSEGELNEGVTRLEPSGYLRVQHHSAVALLDVAPVGPDYLPGHAHADTLSFELSVRGQRLLVNSGTSLYGGSSERLRQRGTAAHNTVGIDDADSSEVWSGFRVARRAYPSEAQVSAAADGILVRASHDGYRRLGGQPVHQRQWTFGENRMTIRDSVAGDHGKAVAHFHFHPAIELFERDGGIKAILPDGSSVSVHFSGGTPRLVESSWHPEFGLSVGNRKAQVTIDAPVLLSTFSW